MRIDFSIRELGQCIMALARHMLLEAEILVNCTRDLRIRGKLVGILGPGTQLRVVRAHAGKFNQIGWNLRFSNSL